MANRHVSITTAKTRFSALIGEVASQREHGIIKRRGQPMAAMIEMQDIAPQYEQRSHQRLLPTCAAPRTRPRRGMRACLT